MRGGGIGLAVVLLSLMALPARAQSVSEAMSIRAAAATTWFQPPADVILLRGPVQIELDHADLSAGDAVIWLTPAPDGPRDARQAQIALLGEAQVRQNGATRSGDRLLVTTTVRDDIRILADSRRAIDQSNDPLFGQALDLRQDTLAALPLTPETPQATEVVGPAPQTRPRPAAAPAPSAVPVSISGSIESTSTLDAKLALVLVDVLLMQQGDDGTIVQLQADRGVLFTDIDATNDLRALATLTNTQQSLRSAYLEGDVRISQLPPRPDENPERDLNRIDQRLEADRVYYDFVTRQAVLTDAIFRTTSTEPQIPLTVRADVIRQLAQTPQATVLSAQDARLSTSSFQVPSYALAADRVYVRQEQGAGGGRTTISARDVTFRTFGVPVFWLPWAGGTVSEGGLPLRSISIGNSKNFGFGVETEWGLFETFGSPHPEDADATYRLDYFSERGPALGLSAEYGGGFIRPNTKQPWNFTGEFDSYFVPQDQGVDNLGRYRRRIAQDDEFRGQVIWRHQHYFPENWMGQLQAAWLSDATFREEWFERDFDTSLPLDTSILFKHQQQTEAITFLTSIDLNNFVTSADQLQETVPNDTPSIYDDPNLLVERIPEIGYERIGDSLGERATFFSSNSFSGLQFVKADATLGDLGFRRIGGAPGPADDILVNPGLPSIGTTGYTGDTVYRGDFRQELDYPFMAGPFNVVPYLVGRLTAYTDSPDGTNEERWLGGGGLRIGTAFWKVSDDVRSRLFDLNRLRHVVEPELHLFTSAESIDRGELFIYDEPVDAVTNVSALSLGLRQRWQTKRGAPGRQRSADVFTLNTFVNLFDNEPNDLLYQPDTFRGLYFPSHPEASIPRDSLNIDALWRLSDTTLVLADMAHNLDENEFATGSVGLAVQRGDRLSYFAGVRYIDPLDSTIASFIADYELTRKYAIGLSQSYDFDDDGRVYSSLRVQRRFDTFVLLVSTYYDDREDESGFNVSFYPEGLGVALGTTGVSGLFGR